MGLDKFGTILSQRNSGAGLKEKAE